jgi:DNA-binding Xre family transcriptional regulator
MNKRKRVEVFYSIDTRKVQVMMFERRLTLKKLAARWGVSFQAVSAVITNARADSPLRGKLADALGLTLDDILDKAKLVKLNRRRNNGKASSVDVGRTQPDPEQAAA